MENSGNQTPKSHGGGDPHSRKPLLVRYEERIWGAAEETERGIMVFVKRWLQILDRAFIGFYKNKCFESASALTYTSILTIVPLLAILISVLKGFGVERPALQALKDLPIIKELRVPVIQRSAVAVHYNPIDDHSGTTVSQPIFPDSTAPTSGTMPLQHSVSTSSTTAIMTGEQLADQILQYVENTDISSLGFFGVLGLLWAVVLLMSRIESAMNAAWAVHRSRSLSRKLNDYLNMLVIVLLMLVGLSMTVTTKVNELTSFLDRIGVKGLGEHLIKSLPYLIIWLAFIVMYYYIPNTRVKLKSAVVSGLIAGTLFQIMQVFFIRTQIVVGRYNKIYGTFAILLILLVWAYFSWCIVLWGAQVCSANQNLRDWRRRRRLWGGTPAERETLALRMAALLASPLLGKSGSKRMDAGDLADALTLPLEPVGEIIDLFQTHGMLVQSAEDGGYIFGRSPESVTVLDILRLVRQGTLASAQGAPGLLNDVASEIKPTLEGKTVKDLVTLPLEDIKTIIL